MSGGISGGFSQRSIEELVKAETKPGPGGEPPRPRTWLGAASMLGFILALVVLILVGDCAGPGDEPSASPTPSPEAVAVAMPSGHTWGPVRSELPRRT